MNDIYIDLDNCDSKQNIHELLKHKLQLPAYYGGNLDALYDELTSIYVQTKLHLLCHHSENSEINTYISKVIDVFIKAQELNSHLTFILES